MTALDDGPVQEYFAINLRQAREAQGLSQAELAEKLRALGHSFNQATIWKLEQNHREPKLSEVVALGRALGLWSWRELTVKPPTFDAALAVDRWRARMYELAERTRAAAAAQIDAQVQLAFAVREALDAGLAVEWATARSGGWLEFAPEITVLREVLAARVAWGSEDEEADRRLEEQDALMTRLLQGLEHSGVPLAVRPDEIEPDPGLGSVIDKEQQPER